VIIIASYLFGVNINATNLFLLNIFVHTSQESALVLCSSMICAILCLLCLSSVRICLYICSELIIIKICSQIPNKVAKYRTKNRIKFSRRVKFRHCFLVFFGICNGIKRYFTYFCIISCWYLIWCYCVMFMVFVMVFQHCNMVLSGIKSLYLTVLSHGIKRY
jgi:hypothetical protein